MLKNKTKKYLIAILIFGQAVALPGLAFANGDPTGPLNPISITDGGSAIANATFQTAFGPIVTANAACATAESAYQKSNGATKAGFSGLSIIGGSSALVEQLGQQWLAYGGFEDCRQAVAKLLTGLPTTNSYNDNQRQALLTQVNASIQGWKAKEDQTLAQLNNASQGFWKTLVFNILIQTTKSVADALVTKLVNNYKITNIKQYADSVATLMYDNQYLRDNFPDAQGQLMARAILNQPELRNQIQPGIFVAANAALGFNPTSLSPSDPNYYQKMAMVGSSTANPYFLQASYVSSTDQAHAQALAQANAQIAQSQGFKTPVNCAGSLAQQQQIDTQAKAASDQLANRQALLASLQAAGPAASQSDLAKAQADYNNALIKWNNIPFTVTGSSSVSSVQQGGGNNTEGTMAIAMCEAISSPATLINKGIDQAFSSVGVNMSQYNNNNLPAFITLISQAASQIGSSLIFGGTSAAKSAALANENIVANGAVASVNQTLSANAAGSAAAAVTFVIVPNGGASTANAYQANWSVDSGTYPSASRVTIVGDGVSAQNLPTSGATTITTTKGGNYTLTVYDSNGNTLASSVTTVNPNSTSASIGSSSSNSSGSITISPASGLISAGDNINISCSNLSVPSGSQIVVDVNNISIPQSIPITNGSCFAQISVTKSNNFITGINNTVSAWVGDSTASANQISGAPVSNTANLAIVGNVLGAFTNIPVLETRGAPVIFNPRGQ